MPVRPIVCTGCGSGAEYHPVPNSPSLFSPHAQTVPSARTARLWRSPAETWVTWLSSCTGAGEYNNLLSTAPLPNCPQRLLPHAYADEVPLEAAAPAGPGAATPAALTASAKVTATARTRPPGPHLLD